MPDSSPPIDIKEIQACQADIRRVEAELVTTARSIDAEYRKNWAETLDLNWSIAMDAYKAEKKQSGGPDWGDDSKRKLRGLILTEFRQYGAAGLAGTMEEVQSLAEKRQLASQFNSWHLEQTLSGGRSERGLEMELASLAQKSPGFAKGFLPSYARTMREAVRAHGQTIRGLENQEARLEHRLSREKAYLKQAGRDYQQAARQYETTSDQMQHLCEFQARIERDNAAGRDTSVLQSYYYDEANKFMSWADRTLRNGSGKSLVTMSTDRPHEQLKLYLDGTQAMLDEQHEQLGAAHRTLGLDDELAVERFALSDTTKLSHSYWDASDRIRDQRAPTSDDKPAVDWSEPSPQAERDFLHSRDKHGTAVATLDSAADSAHNAAERVKKHITHDQHNMKK